MRAVAREEALPAEGHLDEAVHAVGGEEGGIVQGICRQTFKGIRVVADSRATEFCGRTAAVAGFTQ